MADFILNSGVSNLTRDLIGGLHNLNGEVSEFKSKLAQETKTHPGNTSSIRRTLAGKLAGAYEGILRKASEEIVNTAKSVGTELLASNRIVDPLSLTAFAQKFNSALAQHNIANVRINKDASVELALKPWSSLATAENQGYSVIIGTNMNNPQEISVKRVTDLASGKSYEYGEQSKAGDVPKMKAILNKFDVWSRREYPLYKAEIVKTT
jgi:hypothetical protein